ncbi:hypothetical protein [Armatimonas rosea]|nr:hypothetical protein [Armatimonas rosea]
MISLLAVSLLACTPSTQAQTRVQELYGKAQQALKAGDIPGASKLAREVLQKNTDKKAWYYGNLVYEANQLLGLVALREGKVAAAKSYLLAAGKTPGSPQLSSFGPTMTLAQELLKKGEKQAVLDFLDEVAAFWATPKPGQPASLKALMDGHAAQLRQWKAEIRAGKQPTLNRVR